MKFALVFVLFLGPLLVPSVLGLSLLNTINVDDCSPDHFQCPGGDRCLNRRLLCDQIYDCPDTRIDENEEACNKWNTINANEEVEVEEFAKLIDEVAPSKVGLPLLVSLSSSPKARQLLLLADEESVLLEWDEGDEDRYRDKIDVARVRKRYFASSFNYSGRLFVLANPEHGYMFVLDSVGVVHVFSNQYRRDQQLTYDHNKPAFGLYFYPGQNIIRHPAYLGEVGLDWRNDLLVFYNAHTNCIESIKLTRLGQIYRLVCLPAQSPRLHSLVVNVEQQKVAYFIGKEIRFVSLLASPVQLLVSSGAQTADVRNKTSWLNYDYEGKKVIVLRNDQQVIKAIVDGGQKHTLLLNHTEQLAGATDLALGKALVFWYNPTHNTAYLYRAREDELFALDLTSLLPVHKTVHAVLFVDGQLHLPRALYHCSSECAYLCRNSGVPRAKCACPNGFNKLRDGECKPRLLFRHPACWGDMKTCKNAIKQTSTTTNSSESTPSSSANSAHAWWHFRQTDFASVFYSSAGFLGVLLLCYFLVRKYAITLLRRLGGSIWGGAETAQDESSYRRGIELDDFDVQVMRSPPRNEPPKKEFVIRI